MKRVFKKTVVFSLLIFIVLAFGIYVFANKTADNRQAEVTDLIGQQAIGQGAGYSREAVGEQKTGLMGYPADITMESTPESRADSDKQTIVDGATSVSGNNIYSLPSMGEKAIRMASVELQVKKGKFNDAYDRAVNIVTGVGGYISESKSTAAGNGITGGELVLRIPAAKFENTLAALKKLGKLESLDIFSEEVSAEYVDLQSRLRNWRAQEAVMLDLMSRAKTISDSITIQNNLQQIQMEVERISGRLQYIDDRVSYTSIRLHIAEPHAAVPRDPLGVKEAFKNALKASSLVAASFIVTIGYLLPFLLIGLLSYLVYLIIKRMSVRHYLHKQP